MQNKIIDKYKVELQKLAVEFNNQNNNKLYENRNEENNEMI